MKINKLNKRLKSVFFFTLLAVSALFFQGCSDDTDAIVASQNQKEETSDVEKIGYTDYNGYKIFNNVKVIKTTENLIQLGDNNVTFAKSEQINTIKEGDIIVGDIMPNAPYGFIRKVIAISNNNNNVKIQTEMGSLDDVVAEGDIDINKDGYELYYDGSDFDFQGVEKLGGIDEFGVQRKTISKSFSYKKTKNYKGLKFEVKGKATVKFNFHWSKKWIWRGFKSRLRTNHFESSAELVLTNTVTAGANQNVYNQRVSLMNYKLPTLKFWVGPVPIIIKNKFYIDYSVKSKHKIEFGATLNYNLKLGVKYQRKKGWSPIKESKINFYPFVKSNATVFQSTIDAPIVGVKGEFYGYSGARVYSDLRQVTFLNALGNKPAKPIVYISGHTQFTAGARLRILGFKANYEYKKNFWPYTNKIVRITKF